MELQMELSQIELTKDGIRFMAKAEGQSFPVLILRELVQELLNFPPQLICSSEEARQIIEQNKDRVHAAMLEAYRKNLVDKNDKLTLVVMRDCF